MSYSFYLGETLANPCLRRNPLPSLEGERKRGGQCDGILVPQRIQTVVAPMAVGSL